MATGGNPLGFWSYAHTDNDAEGGRIIRLSQHIKNEYELITGGENIEIFVDRADIQWGKKWRTVIDEALTETAFFIPIVTARYVQRPECRRELLIFSANAERRGVPELLLPIIYVPVPGLEESSTDEVKAVLAATQYEDWTDLRFEDEESPRYRRGINKLALRLAEIADEISTRPERVLVDMADSGVAEAIDPDGDDALGMLDAMAEIEEGFPAWTATMTEYQTILGKIADLFTDYEPKMARAAKKNTSARLIVAKRLAGELDPLADSLKLCGIQYLDQAKEMDGNMSLVLSQIARTRLAESDRDSFTVFSNALRGIAEGGRVAIEAVEGFQADANDAGRMSKDIRVPLRKVSEGAQSLIDGQDFFDEWVRRLDEIEEGL